MGELKAKRKNAQKLSVLEGNVEVDRPFKSEYLHYKAFSANRKTAKYPRIAIVFEQKRFLLGLIIRALNIFQVLSFVHKLNRNNRHNPI